MKPSIEIRGPLQSMKWYEAEILAHALEASNYNLSKTAEALEIGRMTLYRKLAKYGLHGSVNRGQHPPAKTPLQEATAQAARSFAAGGDGNTGDSNP